MLDSLYLHLSKFRWKGAYRISVCACICMHIALYTSWFGMNCLFGDSVIYRFAQGIYYLNWIIS